MTREFRLPDLGEGVHEGQIVRIRVQEGEAVREDQPLLEVETDKAAVEIPSPFTATVAKVHVKEQQVVNVGDVMVTFVDGDDTARSAASPGSQAVAPTRDRTAAPRAGASRPGRTKPASPAVRKLARKLGVELDRVQGSGTGGRVTRADVERAAAGSAPAPAAAPAAPPPAAAVEPAGIDDTDQYGPVRRHPLTQARKTIARVMNESWTTIPHVTDCHDADVTDLDRLRRGYTAAEHPERRLTLLAFLLRAVVRALQRYPVFNASYDANAEQIIYRRYINVGIGVHTERGLIAPVVRDADRLGVPQLADELAVMAEKARNATFAVNDTRGGTYTISNPGALGTTRYSTPLITPPQVAVLGLGRARWEPRVIEGGVVPRFILPLSHSFDHRIIDGGDEVAFMTHLVGDLENPVRLLW